MLKYYFVADAKMSLVSHLLKHWAVARHAGVPWPETRMTRDARTKPVYVADPYTGRQPVAFNVSHQAGLVALVVGFFAGDGETETAAPGTDAVNVEVGVDIVCTGERRERDLRALRSEGGWTGFVDMHADVFGRRETAYLKGGDFPLPVQTQTPLAPDDFKLRHFYTLWCLREAYIKMTGDALLAPWLGDLDFMRFRAPAPGAAAGDNAGDDDGLGPRGVPAENEVIAAHEILFKGTPVGNANVCIRSLGREYMVCTAVRTPLRKEDALGLDLRCYDFLSLEDILAVAEVGQ